MAGDVLIDEQVFDKPGKSVAVGANIRVRATLPFVSRGGLKLAKALDTFELDVGGLVAVDVGASTGGFTDCLLQRGIGQVYAVDVGYGQLAWKLRQDPRVVVIERTNIRYLERLPIEQETPDRDANAATPLANLAVIDTSFISLRLVLPATLRLLHGDAFLITLIKPQFEAGKEQVGKGGVVRDRATHGRVLEETILCAQQLGLSVAGLTASPLLGPAGNVEFLAWLCRGKPQQPLLQTRELVDHALHSAEIVRSQSKRR